MSKRADNEGTVYESPKGSGRWWAQLPADSDGKRPRRRAESKEAAADLLHQMRAERKAGKNHAQRPGTVASLVEQYLAVTKDDVSPATFCGYTKQLQHVVRHYGTRPYDEIDFLAVKLLHGKLRRDGLGHDHTVNILRRLRTAFDLVLEQLPGGRNPVDFRRMKLRRPKNGAGDDPGEKHWPAELIRALLLAADDVEVRGGLYRFSIMWWLGFLLGLRRCEITALRWQDVDWKAGTLHVRYHWALTGTGGYALKPGTKNGKPFKLPIGPRLLERLRVQWELHQQDRRRPGWHEQGFIVCREDGSPLNDLAGVNWRLGTLCRDAGLPHCNPHKMRHSCASLISDLGYSDAVIAAVLNHISESTVTRGYTHANPETVRQAIERVEAQILGAAAEGARGAK